MTVKKATALRGFTLAELLIGLILFSIVMAVSGAAISSAMSLLHRETDKAISSSYVDGVGSYLSKQVKYALHVDITSTLTAADGRYNKYLDSDKSPDNILYISNGRIYLVEGTNNGHATKKTVLYEMNGNDISLVCRPDREKGKAVFELTVSENGKKGKEVYSKSFAVSRLNDHIGYFEAEGTIPEFKDNYYICIDNDDLENIASGDNPVADGN